MGEEIYTVEETHDNACDTVFSIGRFKSIINKSFSDSRSAGRQ